MSTGFSCSPYTSVIPGHTVQASPQRVCYSLSGWGPGSHVINCSPRLFLLLSGLGTTDISYPCPGSCEHFLDFIRYITEIETQRQPAIRTCCPPSIKKQHSKKFQNLKYFMKNKNKTLGTIAFPSYQGNHRRHFAVLIDFSKAKQKPTSHY